ncbi:amidohydrolase family protein [Vibrio aestuarianus]|uniref:amidohydrolase family protein n=1 Tax=Vibrio aestuarianus TaxID=28171 RepID=UPI001559DE0D|nr:amidohydrolase family protein [Vibrio aestuarianus]NGZ14659.1 amidohydrolase family protein [Vibrio aestuarianus]NKZ50807.1 amidohydrolase family protein [Vibrio aestuarianus]
MSKLENDVIESVNVDQSKRKTLQKLAVGAAAIPFSSVVYAEADKMAKKPLLMPNEKGPFDVVIINGRVVDPETGLDAVRNVGIKGDRIAAVSTDKLEGTKVIDATGLVVAPGFVDIHAHGQQLPAARAQAFDGVTTALEMESGLLPIGKFYDDTAKEGRPINYGASVAWAFARIMAKEPDFLPADGTLTWFQKAFALKNWQNTIATEDELKTILADVEQGLKEGGLGIGINGGYAPGYGHKEYYALAKLAKSYEVPTYTHVRYANGQEPKSSFEAYQELISLSATTGAHMHICHLNSSSVRDIDDCADLVQEAIDKGLPVTTEAYPYGAGSTAVGAELFAGADWTKRFGVPDASYMEANGKAMTQAKIDELRETNPGEIVVIHFIKPDDSKEDLRLMKRSVLFPGAAIASDAMPWMDAKGKLIEGDVWPLPSDAFAHPRSVGCFARFVNKYVNDYKAVSLVEAMERTSLNACRTIEDAVPQMRNKGRIQVGKDADVVIFDLNTFKDTATFTKPNSLSVGMKHVLVNGQSVIENEQLIMDALPGKAIRREIKA